MTIIQQQQQQYNDDSNYNNSTSNHKKMNELLLFVTTVKQNYKNLSQQHKQRIILGIIFVVYLIFQTNHFESYTTNCIKSHRSDHQGLIQSTTSSNDDNRYLTVSKSVTPKRPARIFRCGYDTLFTDFETNILDLLFPDVPDENRIKYDGDMSNITTEDDILLFSCATFRCMDGSGAPIEAHFHGKILTFNGESKLCLQHRARDPKFYTMNRIYNVIAVDGKNLSTEHNEHPDHFTKLQQHSLQTPFFGGLILSLYPKHIQQQFFNETIRKYRSDLSISNTSTTIMSSNTNNSNNETTTTTTTSTTGNDVPPQEQRSKFLVYAASNCQDFRDESFIRLARLGYNNTPAYYAGHCHGGMYHEKFIVSNNNNDVEDTWLKHLLLLQEKEEKEKIQEIVTNSTLNGTDINNLSNSTNNTTIINSILPLVWPLPPAKIQRAESGNGNDNWWTNIQFFQQFRFVLCMENKRKSGYITEKIINVFAAGSIPIYYGPKPNELYDVFNRKAFIYMDIEYPLQALQKVYYLEQNRTAYEEMLREPILAHGDLTMAKYFSFSDDIGNGYLKWEIRKMLGYN